MDYRDTINLPFTELAMKAGLSKKEPDILNFWQKEDIYQAIRDLRSGNEKFILHDGPPYANGDIHLGHAVNKVLKDITIKYQSLLGKDAPYVPGWDCHGLPIELNIEKKHGKSSNLVKDKIKFIEACREYASSQISNQKSDFKRLGVLGDWENSYHSMDPSYEADITRALGRIIANGHLHRGEKPVHWCYDCKSALAEAEVEYQEKTSRAIYVKFNVQKDSLNNLNKIFKSDINTCSVIIWTTTPWTLPGNVAVSIGSKINYSLCEIIKKGYCIIASDLVQACSDKWDEDIKVLGTVLGKDIKDITLDHPYINRSSVLIHGDHVTVESGTGCVHTAPAHGIDDYFICQKYKLKTIHALNKKGFFLDEYESIAGLPAVKADDIIVDELKTAQTLVDIDDFSHSYPHCWRHKSPLIFASTPQWFISMHKSGLLEGAIAAVDSVKWQPDWGKKRILSMLEGRPDWCISRQRNWGVPIPLIVHKDSGDIHPKQNVLFNKIADLIEEHGLEAWDQVELDQLIDDSAHYVKTFDTLDVWFDSGVTHFAVLDKLYGTDLVADLYLEGSDQHRGWFQSSLLTGIGINGVAPYKEVLTHGFVVDEQGIKQSKSLGNAISPQKIWDSLGADILRLWIASTDFRSEMVASDEIFKRVSDQYRRIRNTIRFLLANLNDFEPNNDSIAEDNLLSLDKWIIQRANRLQHEVIQSYRNYEYHQVVQKLHNFCVLDLGGTYLDIIKDRQYTTQQDSLPRRSAQTSIDIVLNILVRLISPILSYTAEEVWQTHASLKKQTKSVFLTDITNISVPNNDFTEAEWDRLFEIKDSVNQSIEEVRNSGQIKGSLDAVIEISAAKDDLKILKKFGDELHFIFIVSDCTLKESKTLSCKVYNSSDKKCIRCWHKNPSVGISKKHPEICSRCETNIEGEGEVRRFV
tara:strand:+ start:2134 stop:4899 length:2766 start_codon:yes stop_codon:yes gene_type:complete